VATSAAERHTIWDLTIGQTAATLPEDFVDFACGTNGGPPGQRVKAFTDYMTCAANSSGLHEVYFRYNDEQEYVARALSMPQDIERFRGTRVYGIDAAVAALFDEAGVLQGLEIASDPRGLEPGVLNDQWRLGALLMRRFGEADWTCTDIPLSDRELPVTSYSVKRGCTKTVGGLALTVEQNYYHRRGESFTDEYGTVQPTHFVSNSSFELLSIASLP
jgi:hypothetical protein